MHQGMPYYANWDINIQVHFIAERVAFPPISYKYIQIWIDLFRSRNISKVGYLILVMENLFQICISVVN